MAKKRLKKKKFRAHNICTLCGKKISLNNTPRIVGLTGAVVCSVCLKTATPLTQIPSVELPKPISPMPTSAPGPDEPSQLTPQDLVKELDKSIIGQDQAKRSLAVALWKQTLRASGIAIPKSSLLLYGPTGCGKTALVQEAAKLTNLPCLVVDSTSLTESGYRGRDAKDIIIDLSERFGPEKARYGVVFLDEVDKLRSTKENEYRSSYQRGTQHSLLKLIEGTQLQIAGEPFSTSDILFLFGGAFTGLQENPDRTFSNAIGFERTHSSPPMERSILPEDFVSFGMERELMGRIGRCVPIHPLTKNDLKEILLKSDLSVYRKYQEFFQRFNISLLLNDALVDEFAQKALERGMGARGLNTFVEEWVESQLFSLSKGG